MGTSEPPPIGTLFVPVSASLCSLALSLWPSFHVRQEPGPYAAPGSHLSVSSCGRKGHYFLHFELEKKSHGVTCLPPELILRQDLARYVDSNKNIPAPTFVRVMTDGRAIPQ